MVSEIQTNSIYQAPVQTEAATFGACVGVAAVAADETLFETPAATEATASVDTTETASKAQSVDTAALQSQLSAKEKEVSSLDADIKKNASERKAACSELKDANASVSSARKAYEDAALAYSAAASELAELESANFFSKLFNSGKINELKATVAQLKQEAEKAQDSYDKEVEKQKEILAEIKELNEENKTLTGAKKVATGEYDELKQQLEAAVNEAEAEAEKEAAPADSTDGKAETLSDEVNPFGDFTDEDLASMSEEEIAALREAGLIPAGEDETVAPEQQEQPEVTEPESQTDAEFEAYLKELEEKAKADQLAAQTRPDFHREDNEINHERVFELFGGELSREEINFMGLSLLDMVQEASKVYETKMFAQTYAKSSTMATADGATSKEHSKAESNFTDALLDISDIVNGTDVEFFNITDESNYELAMNVLDRINQGEYIKTSVLEQHTSTVKNIQLQEVDQNVESNDAKYEQYSDAILDELQNLTDNPFGTEISEEEYQAIETKFNFLAASNVENAFDYLEEQADKYGVTEAVAA